MRVIDGFERAVRAVAVSADGRFLAAASSHVLAVWDWAGGERWRAACGSGPQLAFSPDGEWLATCAGNDLQVWPTDGRPPARPAVAPGSPLGGGVAFAPDGKHLVAGRNGPTTWPLVAVPGVGRLERWAVPSWQPAPGIDYWEAFPRLEFSRNGDFLAGIHPFGCQLRFARVGGRQGEVRRRGRAGGTHPFLSFAPDSRTLLCGWDDELHVVDTGNGREARREIRSPDAPFRDAAFTGSGRHAGTVDGAGVLRLWDAEAWEVERAFDWGAGPLTCLAFTADGLAGVCGTAAGQLVLFDLE